LPNATTQPSTDMAPKSDAALLAVQWKIAAVVASYFCAWFFCCPLFPRGRPSHRPPPSPVISITLVFLNKVMLSDSTSIPAPLAVTWFQCVVTSAILYGLGELGRGAPEGSFFAQFPAATFDYKLATSKGLSMLSLVFVGMITFNNLSLKYVEVSFYNVARSLTIVFNVALTYAMLGEATSPRVLLTLGVVVLGFFLGSASEVRFSWLGSLFGVTSSLFVALNGIYNKKAMPDVGGNVWRLSLYTNVSASVIFLPLILLTGEGAVIAAHAHQLRSAFFWFTMLVGGAFGFAIGIVTSMQIAVTSPLTHNISGTAKACVQTILALVIWGNPTNAANMAGTALVLLGSCAYSYVRNEEMVAERKAKAAAAAPAAPPSDAAPLLADAGAEEEAGGTKKRGAK
jgi:GDP-fucose transporter C1